MGGAGMPMDGFWKEHALTGCRPVPEEGGRRAMGDQVSEAAQTGAALVRHLEDVKFASLRALRQLLRALDAERVAIARLSPGGESLREELVWASGFGRCGDSERVLACSPFLEDIRRWLTGPDLSLSIGIDVRSAAWHDVPCDQLLLVRSHKVSADGESLVCAVQLRGGVRLSDAAAGAIANLLKEYERRQTGGHKVPD